MARRCRRSDTWHDSNESIPIITMQDDSSRSGSRSETDPARPLFAWGAAVLWLLLSFTTSWASAQDPDRSGLTRAEVLQLLDEAPLIDGHNDVPWQYRSRVRNQIDRLPFTDTRAATPPMHTDLARLEASGLGGQFWSIYVPTSVRGPAAVRDKRSSRSTS